MLKRIFGKKNYCRYAELSNQIWFNEYRKPHFKRNQHSATIANRPSYQIWFHVLRRPHWRRNQHSATIANRPLKKVHARHSQCKLLQRIIAQLTLSQSAEDTVWGHLKGLRYRHHSAMRAMHVVGMWFGTEHDTFNG